MKQSILKEISVELKRMGATAGERATELRRLERAPLEHSLNYLKELKQK